MAKKKASRKVKPADRPKDMFDYATAAGLNLPPDLAEELNRIMYDDPREVVYQLERETVEVANQEFEQLRLRLAEEEAERQRLWGDKFPPVRGQKPQDLSESKTGGKARRRVVLRPIPYKG